MNSPVADAEMPIISEILVIDDTPTNLRVLSSLLTEQGYKVRLAPNGRLALMNVQTDPPDLILLDILMPEMNGFEVCRRLKADMQLRLIPIVVMTSTEGNEEKMRAVEAGADEFLSKPLNRAEVTVRLRSLARINRFNQELIGAESVAFALAYIWEILLS